MDVKDTLLRPNYIDRYGLRQGQSLGVMILIGLSLALSVRKKKIRKFRNLELGVNSTRMEYKFLKRDLTG